MAHYISPFEKQRTKGMPLVPSHTKNVECREWMGWDGMGLRMGSSISLVSFFERWNTCRMAITKFFREIVTFLLVSAHELHTSTYLDS